MAKSSKSSKPKGLSVKKNPVGVTGNPARDRKREDPRARQRNFSKPVDEPISLKGVVTSADGVPLPGLTVGLKGAKQKVSISDPCGNFELNIPSDYIGILVFGWAKNTASAEINLEGLKKLKNIIISLKAVTKYENTDCEKNYKKAKRILI